MTHEQDLDLDDPLLGGWPDRWRHPGLLAELERNADASVAARAYLQDLAQPPRDLAAALRTLLDHGDFAAATRLTADIALLERQGLDPADVADRVADAVAAAEQARNRRAFELQAKAEAAGVVVADGTGEKAVDEQLLAGERQRRTDIQSRLAAAGVDDADFAALVRSCLDAREYAAAEHLLDVGPDAQEDGVPVLVRRPRPWPYTEPIAIVLGWFEEGAAVPRDFAVRRPPQSDGAGCALVAALRAAHTHLDASTARTLAEALDGLLLDVPPSRQQPVPLAGGGFQVRLSGCVDQRVQWFGLHGRTSLTLGPLPPEPGDEVAIWMPLDDVDPDVLVDRVALLRPLDLLEIVAPTPGGRISSRQERRINLLRALSRTLDPASVVAQPPSDLGDGPEMREAIIWMLDLLGLGYREPALPDVIRYDTSGQPTAVCATVQELGRRMPRPGDLTLEDLAALRGDPAAVRRIRSAIVRPLGDDKNALVVLGALVLREDAGTTAAEHTVLAAELAELGGRATPMVGAQHVDVRHGIDRLNAAGLARSWGTEGRDQSARFCGPGLAALLHDDALLTDTVRWLHEVHADAEDRARTLRIGVESMTRHAYQHLYDNYVFLQGQLALALTQTDLPSTDLLRMRNRLAQVAERLTTLRLAIDGRFDELATLDFDLRDTLVEFVQLHDGATAVEVREDEPTAGRLPVRGIEVLVQLALDDLVVNAHRAMDRAGSVERRIRVTVSVVDREIERVAVLDVEDSGPGFDALTEPDVERQRAGLRGGDGLANAITALRYCRGELECRPEPSAFGGAHVRVVLPLAFRS